MSNSVAILFSSPKMAGKDVAIDRLISRGYPLTRRECKDKLHVLTQELFCITPERYWEIYNDRELKELPLPEFKVTKEALFRLSSAISIPNKRLVGACKVGAEKALYLSIREAIIYVSECVAKPMFGADYFGKVRANSILDNEVIVDGSCGFVEELPPLIEKVGMDNILLIRVHRPGYTFEGDSRNYIPDDVILHTVDIYNDETLEHYLYQVESWVWRFLRNRDVVIP